MDFTLYLNEKSKDKRVAELAKLKTPNDAKTKILFVEPRAPIPENLGGYDYVFGYPKHDEPNYVCLNDDETFIEENNLLTALAMKEILIQNFGADAAGGDMKILIAGYGKLTRQLEFVLSEADISVLNFNHRKAQELKAKYNDKAYFEYAPLNRFDIIINTIPKQVLPAAEIDKDTFVYDLASDPYGVSGVQIIRTEDGRLRADEASGIKYEILPGLPGKYYPEKAAKCVLDAINRFTDALDKRPVIVLCVTGSSCCYTKLLSVLDILTENFNVIPVLSPNANLPNRFCDVDVFRQTLADKCKHSVLTTIAAAETLSANKNIVASVVLPATGNTVAKLSAAVTDTCVTMAVKALLRNGKPCIIGISTNDGLSGNASNIGTLLNRKNYYFVPFSQDDPINKPYSLVCDFSKTIDTVKLAVEGKQLQPILCK